MPVPFNPRPKALYVFIIAEQFRNASKLSYLREFDQTLRKWFPYDTAMAGPVCAAFACELYFKCLIRLGRRSIDQIHNLKKNFSKIGKRNQAKIRRYFRENRHKLNSDVEHTYKVDKKPVPKVDFDYALTASADAFISLRYIFEHARLPPGQGWLGDVILEGARKAILEKHPEWEGARQVTLRGTPGIRSTSRVR